MMMRKKKKKKKNDESLKSSAKNDQNDTTSNNNDRKAIAKNHSVKKKSMATCELTTSTSKSVNKKVSLSSSSSSSSTPYTSMNHSNGKCERIRSQSNDTCSINTSQSQLSSLASSTSSNAKLSSQISSSLSSPSSSQSCIECTTTTTILPPLRSLRKRKRDNIVDDDEDHENDVGSYHGNKYNSNCNNSANYSNKRKKKVKQKYSRKLNKWQCQRCTYLNSNRRKKCEICRTSKELSISIAVNNGKSDEGTFDSIGDGDQDANGDGSNDNNGIFDGSNTKTRMSLSSSSIDKSSHTKDDDDKASAYSSNTNDLIAFSQISSSIPSPSMKSSPQKLPQEDQPPIISKSMPKLNSFDMSKDDDDGVALSLKVNVAHTNENSSDESDDIHTYDNDHYTSMIQTQFDPIDDTGTQDSRSIKSSGGSSRISSKSSSSNSGMRIEKVEMSNDKPFTQDPSSVCMEESYLLDAASTSSPMKQNPSQESKPEITAIDDINIYSQSVNDQQTKVKNNESNNDLNKRTSENSKDDDINKKGCRQEGDRSILDETMKKNHSSCDTKAEINSKSKVNDQNHTEVERLNNHDSDECCTKKIRSYHTQQHLKKSQSDQTTTLNQNSQSPSQALLQNLLTQNDAMSPLLSLNTQVFSSPSVQSSAPQSQESNEKSPSSKKNIDENEKSFHNTSEFSKVHEKKQLFSTSMKCSQSSKCINENVCASPSQQQQQQQQQQETKKSFSLFETFTQSQEFDYSIPEEESNDQSNSIVKVQQNKCVEERDGFREENDTYVCNSNSSAGDKESLTQNYVCEESIASQISAVDVIQTKMDSCDEKRSFGELSRHSHQTKSIYQYHRQSYKQMNSPSVKLEVPIKANKSTNRTPSTSLLVSNESKNDTIAKTHNMENAAIPNCTRDKMGFLAGFTLAGSNKLITITEEGMAKANAIFNSECRTTTSKTAVENDSLSIRSFAGSKVGEEGILKVSENCRYNSNKKSSSDDFNMAGSKKAIDDTKSRVTKDYTILNGNTMPPLKSSNSSTTKKNSTTNGFKLAGSKTVVKINDEGLAMANAIFNDEAVSHPHQRTPSSNKCIDSNFSSGFTLSGSKKTIKVTEEAMAKANTIFNDRINTIKKASHYDKNSKKSAPVGFATAGSKKHIAVTDEMMAKANEIFSKKPVQRHSQTLNSSIVPAAAGFTLAGSKKHIAVTDEMMAKANEIFSTKPVQRHSQTLNSSIVPAAAGFTLAGSKKPIEVTEEALNKANDIFNEKPIHANYTHKTGSGPLLGNNAKFNGALLEGTLKGGSSFSNGLNREESSKAHYGEFVSSIARPGFTMVGSNKPIAVTEEMMAQARSILNQGPKSFLQTKSMQPSTKSFSHHNRIKNPYSSNKTEFIGVQKSLNNNGESQVTQFRTPKLKPVQMKSAAITRTNELKNCYEKRGFVANFPNTPSYAWGQSNYVTPVLNKVLKPGAKQGSELMREKSIAVPKMLNYQQSSEAIASHQKLSLRSFASKYGPMETDSSYSGASDIVLAVTACNSVKLRFDTKGLPIGFSGQMKPGVPCLGHTKDLRSELNCKGCEDKHLADTWISNHFRWIVWKLASMERRFPNGLAENSLTYNNVVNQLKFRYDYEITSCKRPALRKVLNRDMAASRMMILLVSKISMKDSGVKIQLSDGWYFVPAVIDSHLQKFVKSGKIQVGSKLLVCNAVLEGADEGIDPLDLQYQFKARTFEVRLKLFANSTRLCKWDAKLGMVYPTKTIRSFGGTLGIKSLADIIPGGGSITSINLVICKVYPVLYKEKSVGMNKEQSQESLTLTKSQYSQRQKNFEDSQQQILDKSLDHIRKEVIDVR